MNLYILRHAVAVSPGTPGFPNDDRPLTESGIKKMKQAARSFPDLVESVDAILTSPLQRAVETAKIAALALNCEKNLEVCSELLPETSSQKILTLLKKYAAKPSVMIVGHEPSLSTFASLLLGSGESVIILKKGGMCKIEVSGLPAKPAGMLHWHLAPRQLRQYASD